MTARPWRTAPGGVTLAVRAVPRAGREAVGGVAADAAGRAALTVRVTTPAEGGRANAAVTAAVAKALGLPKSAVRLVAGAASRDKRLAVEGDAAALAARLERLAAAGRGPSGEGG